ncbi:hypothetical protein EW145_g1988 [Phellinidium pouzarii]|uniref:CRA domain-containing protein n=1 Tax=Phellinidium pouzarii TaxID=167371 RepID=A0A4S4LHZ9_9AGAM|nr:hypothetical protein EW145_g1988 [Phellinidium pouzarii]
MSSTKRLRLSKNASDAGSNATVSVRSDDEQFTDEDVSDLAPSDLAEAQRPPKSKKTQKRKRRATSPSQFGATLQSLLNTNAPTNLPLSLKPSVAKRRTDEVLEGKAKKLLEVVKLFNAIQQTQVVTAAVQEEAKAERGSGKPTLPAPVLDSKSKQKKNMPPSNQKLVVRKEEWDKRLHEVQVTKNDLNRLVMDYLVIEGYKSAAEEFSREADLASPVDFQSIEDRTNIREALQRGDVEEAIIRVNDLNPENKLLNCQLTGRFKFRSLIRILHCTSVFNSRSLLNTSARDVYRKLSSLRSKNSPPRGEESPEFLLELERTMALLAFESTPVVPPAIAELLSPAQRLRTAGELNAAILKNFSHGKEAKLVALIKLLCWGESMLEEKADFPKVDLRDKLYPESGRP